METPTAAKAQASDPPAKRIRTDDAKTINDARTLLNRVKGINKVPPARAGRMHDIVLLLICSLDSPKQIRHSLPRKLLTQRETKSLHG